MSVLGRTGARQGALTIGNAVGALTERDFMLIGADELGLLPRCAHVRTNATAPMVDSSEAAAPSIALPPHVVDPRGLSPPLALICSARMGGGQPEAGVCGNCGAPLHGGFCHVCGQKAVETEVGLHDLLHEAFHELAHLDGKIFQTLRILVTKPGLLTVEFLSGRRARYLSPVRLYLTCSVCFFALAALAPDVTRSVVRITGAPSGGNTPLDPAAEERWREAASARAGHAIVHDFPRVMFVLMPIFGVLTWVPYRSARPFYAAHLYYAIHFHALVFLVLTLAIPLLLAGGIGPAVARAAPLAIMVSHYAGLRRVFGGSRLQTAWKGTAIWVVYVSLVMAMMIAIGLRSVTNATVDGKPEAKVLRSPSLRESHRR